MKVRSWTVYIVVADGFWRAAKVRDFVDNVNSLKGRITLLEPMQSPAPGEPLEAFIDEARRRMDEGVEALRGST